MRISRKAVAVIAAGLLASPVVASSVSAQSSNTQKNITTSASFVGPIPTGITGVNATLDCKNVTAVDAVTGAARYDGVQQLTAAFGTAGGSTSLGFGLVPTSALPVAAGSSCRVIASTQGTAGRSLGAITVVVGGTARTMTPSTTGGVTTWSTDFVAAPTDTTVVLTVSYPQITVKKVVNGDEPVAGFAYPMTLACSGTGSTGFIDALTRANPETYGAEVADSIPNGSLVLPGGAGFYISLLRADTTVPGDTVEVRVYDYRSTVPASTATVINMAGTFDGMNALTQAEFDRVAAIAPTLAGGGGALAPAGGTGFTGSFTLKGGESRSFGNNEIPALSAASMCEVTETASQGGVIGYSSSTTAPVTGIKGTAGGVQAGTVWKSALTAMNETITVSNSFYGDLVISKVVTGDSKSNIATFEISVACDKGGPKDTFLLKDRQSKVYNNIAVGTNCLVTETKSDGAVATYADNVGDNTTDGRVTIKRRGTGCAAVGAATPASPGGPAPTTSFDECWANVIITNDYNPPATTEAPAAAPATAAPATAAPAVTPAPATPVEATATFTG